MGLEFRILVIVICLIFDICDLEFLFLHHSNRLPLGGKTIEATSGGSPKPDSLLVSLESSWGETETRRRGKKNGLLRYSYCLIREAPVVFTQHGSCLKVKVTPRRRASVSLGS